MSQSQTLPQKVLDVIGYSNAGLQKAAAFQREVTEKEAAYKGHIEGCVDALVEFGRIEPHEKEACLQALQDPAQCIQLLTKLAEHRNAEEMAHVGAPISGNGVKTASLHSQDSPYVGGRRGESQADSNFMSSVLGSR